MHNIVEERELNSTLDNLYAKLTFEALTEGMSRHRRFCKHFRIVKTFSRLVSFDPINKGKTREGSRNCRRINCCWLNVCFTFPSPIRP